MTYGVLRVCEMVRAYNSVVHRDNGFTQLLGLME